MIRSLYTASLTDSGRMRPTNEDACYQQALNRSDGPPMGLFIVADGMGGHQAGEVASRLAVETLRTALASLLTVPADDAKRTRVLSEAQATRQLAETRLEARLRTAVQEANQVIVEYARRHPQSAGDMGATVTAVLVRGDAALVANVGDSRTYLWRDGELRQITRDHSVVASLVEVGQLEPEAIYTHPNRSQIYRSLGERARLEVDLFPLELRPGDVLLLCSDGLWEMVRDEAMADVLRTTSSPREACRRLVDQANDNGGEDNISVVIVRVE